MNRIRLPGRQDGRFARIPTLTLSVCHNPVRCGVGESLEATGYFESKANGENKNPSGGLAQLFSE